MIDISDVHVPRAEGGGSVCLQLAQEKLADEANGNREYTEAAARAQDPALKELFLELAGEELEHTKRLTAWIETNQPAEKSAPKTLTVEIAKVQDNVVFGVVLHANKPDLQGDIMSPDDIRKAMHEFMEEFRTINKDHADDINACPVECWQAKEPGKLGNSDYGAGDWLMGTKVNDPQTLADVLTGKYKSYSIEGVGQRIPIAE
jgi:hypothetical protein